LKNSKSKTIFIFLIFLFFITIPFLQSLIFSSNTEGAIKIDKEVKADFIYSDKKIILLFFGYFGCKDVCTPLLYKLSDLYESQEFTTIKDEVDIFFINLTPEAEQDQPDLFAKFFNKNFKGVYLSKKDIFNLDRTFGVFFSRDLSDKTELNHTDFVYLIENNLNSKILKSMYSIHPLKTAKLIDDMILLDSKK
jgi:protein SCO1